MSIETWAIGGGAKHSVDSARRQTYAATGGIEGVGGPSDLKVVPLDVPGQGVRILPGGCLIRSRYSDAQTYQAGVYGDETVATTATGSGGPRSDLVIARVEDPNAQGSPWAQPSDPANAQYTHIRVISGVPAGVKKVQAVPGLQNDTAITLARIDFPASTGTVTAGMIKDLRDVGRPRTEDGLRMVFPTGNRAAGFRIPNAPSPYGDWPVAEDDRPLVRVPKWAAKVYIEATVEGAWYAKGNSTTVGTVGGTRVGIGNAFQADNGIITNGPQDTGDRRGFSIIGEVAVPAALRDTDQLIRVQGVRSGGLGGWWVDYQSCISIRWRFEEAAV